MKVADAIAHALKVEGIDTIFTYPVNPIIEAAAVADIRTIVVRQERIGLHMADAYSRLSSGKKIGVFTMQHGPGSENAFGGVAQAFSESAPILVLPAGYPRRLMHYYPNFNSTLNMRHVTKWAEPLTMGRAIPGSAAPSVLPASQWAPGPGAGGSARGRLPRRRAGRMGAQAELRHAGGAGSARRGAGRGSAGQCGTPGDLRRPRRPLRAGVERTQGVGGGMADSGDHQPSKARAPSTKPTPSRSAPADAPIRAPSRPS